MFDITRREAMWGGRKLVLETGRIARQADGAVLASYGETAVLCTVVGQRWAREKQDFFPLTVNYEEKASAAGKIPGGFFKREGRPSEKETLVSRLIDRPLRPLFVKSFRNETQVICTVLSHDLINDSDIVAMIGASAALTISGLPFMGPIAGCRVGFADGAYVLNPTYEQRAASDLDLVMAGTLEGVLMVESEASELSEDQMLGAVTFGHEEIKPVIEAIVSLAEACAKEPWELPEEQVDTALVERIRASAEAPLREAYAIAGKTERMEKVTAAKAETAAQFREEEGAAGILDGTLKSLEKDIVRGQILDSGARIDGRTTSDVRAIECEVGALPRSHGSALFTRGETQALVTATLGTGQDEQIMDMLEGEYRERFMLHYNFPPYSVGEARFLRGRPAGARSATASSPGGRFIRSCRMPRNSPTPSAWSRRSPNRTAPRRWRRCAGHRSR